EEDERRPENHGIPAALEAQAFDFHAILRCARLTSQRRIEQRLDVREVEDRWGTATRRHRKAVGVGRTRARGQAGMEWRARLRFPPLRNRVSRLRERQF